MSNEINKNNEVLGFRFKDLFDADKCGREENKDARANVLTSQLVHLEQLYPNRN